ncbi:MAG: Sec-independent protein translocase protein TatB [Casimicrobiaceae bacterium]|nr:Sec-independent protein translocase protein TatB [Casimicrobiaceae bacterium]MCX8099161.1 Sec-independent protein translocase protein TatB [Casimicrobiaceae bacterium]MDW8312600.1 Sec-independent protein translocase protein TatB [Burkholderiales bacterium]
MFDISFKELAVVAVVALIVLGPEKLPRLARTAGHWIGRARAYANQVRSDIDREMQLEELRKLQQEAQAAAASVEHSVNQIGRAVEQEVAELETNANAWFGGGSFGEDASGNPRAGQTQASSGALRSAVARRLDSPLAPAWQSTSIDVDSQEEALAASALGAAWPKPVAKPGLPQS